MHSVNRLVALLVVLFATVGCDQATKSIAQSQLSATGPRTFLNGIVSLQYAENSGAFLSLGARLPLAMQHGIFTVATTLVLGALLIFAIRESSRVHKPVLISFALFLGGGIGNLIDRFTNNGHVIDFMHINFMPIGLGWLRTGIFNVADMALMAGVALLMIYGYRTRTSQPLADHARQG